MALKELHERKIELNYEVVGGKRTAQQVALYRKPSAVSRKP
jgi:hypothetical protein